MDELDVAIIDSLLRKPRASWSELSELLEVSTATLSRRWSRLSASGDAWATSWPGPHLWKMLQMAIVRIQPAPNAGVTVAQALTCIPNALTVHQTTGDYSVFALLVYSNLETATHGIGNLLPDDGNITAMAVELCGELYGSISWRLGSLAGANETKLKPPVVNTTDPLAVFNESDRKLFLRLGEDGRASFADIAGTIGATPAQTKRRIDQLQRQGLLDVRADHARSAAGWPINLLIWVSVPQHELTEVGQSVARWNECRLCVEVSGPANLLVVFAVHRRQDLKELLVRVSGLSDHLSFLDRQLVLRQHKLSGRGLDLQGRAMKGPPFNPWWSPEN